MANVKKPDKGQMGVSQILTIADGDVSGGENAVKSPKKLLFHLIQMQCKHPAGGIYIFCTLLYTAVMFSD